MNVLQIHNAYKHFGGEDVVVKLEYELLKNNNIKVRQLLFNNNSLNPLNLLYNKKSYKTVKDLILEDRPDVIHVHNLFYEASPSILKCAFDFKIPVVLTLHNFRLICPNGLLLRNEKPCLKCTNKTFAYSAVKYNCFQESKSKTLVLASGLAYYNKTGIWQKYVDKFIVLTPFAKRIFIESALKVNPEKIVIKSNSVDDFKDKGGTIVKKGYLFIGRLSNEKGIRVAIEAFNNMPDIELHVIGTGPLEDELKKIAKTNVVFHGVKNKEFIKSQLIKSKALIFPSICFEGLPNTILEAYSSGTAIIASDIDNINQIVRNGESGIHFKTGNAKSLKEKIIDFEKSNNSDLNSNARRNYSNHYTHDKNLLSLLKIYQDVVNENEKTRDINSSI